MCARWVLSRHAYSRNRRQRVLGHRSPQGPLKGRSILREPCELHAPEAVFAASKEHPVRRDAVLAEFDGLRERVPQERLYGIEEAMVTISCSSSS